MELAAIIISILSLIATIILATYDVYNSNKINDINLNSGFFLHYYNDYLIDKIPNSRNKLCFDSNGKIINYMDLKNDIIEFLEKSVCYRYLDNEYYSLLKEKIISLEDYLLLVANKNCSDSLQQQICNEIDQKLKNIYNVAQRKYLGK